MRSLLCTLLGAFALSGCFTRPQNLPSPTSTPRAGAGTRTTVSVRGPDGLRPYAQVITSEAKTSSGMFKVHRVGDRLLFEIPTNELNRDMLLAGRFARTGQSPYVYEVYAGDEFAERVLRWQRLGNKVILRSPSFNITADSTLPVYKAVESANNAPIVQIFNVETYGADSAAVIDVTRLYTSPVPEFLSIRGNLDQGRSYIESAQAYPQNVEIEATQTITPQGYEPQPGVQPSAVSVVAHWSMVHLPENPMQPRVFDDRVGYFSIQQVDYGSSEHRSTTRRYINRWRLEKKNPNEQLSEPVKPIVYYIDPATPAQWKQWIKKGVEEWQPAFEAAGFKNAIVALDPPDDPNWSPEDVRNTVIRWLPSPIANAQGPHMHDPRTGEILNGSIRFFHNIMSLQSNWYFSQVSPLDKRAQKLPLPDSLMGRLLQYVVAHEVGHTLGLQHNMKASSQYPLDSLRSAAWVHKMGHTPSIMDYARFNYVAQPEDNIPPEDLIPRVGPYDRFAIMWGYKPVVNAHTPEQEKPTLNSWARMQDSVPWYRFSTSGAYGGVDPQDQSEAVGDADAVHATELGLRNIKRIIPTIMSAGLREGEDNSEIDNLYESVIAQWRTEMSHVVDIVGGVDSREKYGGQTGARFVPISKERQRAAVRFLNEHVFQTPTYLLDTTILRRIEPEGALARIRSSQTIILSDLLDNRRLARMVEFAALSPAPGTTYTVAELLQDIQNGIWSELNQPSVKIEIFRRSLQTLYLQQLNGRINPERQNSGLGYVFAYGGNLTPDANAQMRGQLRDLDAQISSALPRASDSATRLHLQFVRDQIKQILDPPR